MAYKGYWLISAMLLIFLRGINSDVYDVTTIYKFDEPTTGRDFLDTFTEITSLKADLLSDGCEQCSIRASGWDTISGWTVLNSSRTLIPTPQDGRRKLRDTLELTPIDPSSSQIKFVLSAGKISASNVYIYVSSGNNSDISDTYILKLPVTSGSIYLYKCKSYNINRLDANIRSRQCSKSESGVSNYYIGNNENYHIEITQNGFQVREINADWRMVFKQNNAFDININYFGITVDSEQEIYFWKPTNFLVLKEPSGVLETDFFLFDRNAICLSFQYYIQPESGNFFHIKAITQDGKEFHLGKAAARYSDNKLNSWITQRFIREFDSNLQNLKIRVEAEKKSLTDIFIKSISNCKNSETVNSTTLNRRGSKEIQLRNNALGLPAISKNGILFEPNIGVDVQPCTLQSCSWEISNFTEIYGQSTPLYTGEQETLELGYSKFYSQVFQMKNDISFSFQKSQSSRNGGLMVLLMEENELVNEAEMYILYFWNNNGRERCSLRKCGRYGNYHNYIGSDYYTRCEIKESCNIGTYWTDEIYRFNVKIENNHIYTTVNHGVTYKTLFNWKDSSPLNVNFYSFGVIDISGSIIHKPDFWQLNGTEGSFTSPNFIPSQSIICVSVFLNKDYNEMDNNLQVDLLTSGHKKKRFSLLKSTYMDNGWSTELYLTHIMSQDLKNYHQVMLTAQPSDSESKISILRIAGCNGKDLQDTVVISKNDDAINIDYQSYDVAIKTTNSTLGTRTCMNGGVYYEERNGCDCATGFYGLTCEYGCGPDRYGAKCDARCSKTKRGCKNMIFCRPKVGCSCGPGLKGMLCDKACDFGEYGAGCSQKCGNCENGGCDIYTGRCSSGCAEGFYPPLCKKTYKFSTIRPTFEVIDRKTLGVAFTLEPEDLEGNGNPKFYQIQYLECNTDAECTSNRNYKKLEPRPIEWHYQERRNITGISTNNYYQVRVVLWDADGNSYEGEKIPVAKVYPECEVTEDIKFHIEAKDIANEGFIIYWTFNPESLLYCKVDYYELEIIQNSQWHLHYTGKGSSAQFTDLLPGEKYEARVRAITTRGPTPFSNSFSVTTKGFNEQQITGLRIKTVSHNKLEIVWDEPLESSRNIRYRITYECKKLLACSTECSYSAGTVDVIALSYTLHGLLSHAQYLIRVTAYGASVGPATELLAVTEMTVPATSPIPNYTPVSNRTNSSFAVYWEKPENCTYLNGFLYGYRYELVNQDEYLPAIEGSTDQNSAVFRDLTPHMKYTVKVYLETSGGWNPNQPLNIQAQTRATVPGPVENLTVYKRGRQMIGVRWSAPKEMYGDLQSFEISYIGGRTNHSTVLGATPCPIWPHLYCHSSTVLQPDTEYIILVRAKNKEVDEAGEAATVRTITRESAPLPVPYVRTVQQAERDVIVEWGIPNLLNGQLRAFVINILETDSYNSTDCCQYFPVYNIPVKSELPSYQTQVANLRPASTYTISVTAITSALGPGVSITAHTRPPVPELDRKIIEIQKGDYGNSITATVHPLAKSNKLISAYLVLVLPKTSDMDIPVPDTAIWDNWLKNKIAQEVKGKFYVAAELLHENLEENREVTIGEDEEIKRGLYSEIKNPYLESNVEYSLAVVVVLNYCGVLNAGYIESKSFTV